MLFSYFHFDDYFLAELQTYRMFRKYSQSHDLSQKSPDLVEKMNG